MHQLDVLLSTKSKEWEREMERVTSLLKMKEVELQQLAAALKAKDAEVSIHVQYRIAFMIYRWKT